MKISTNSVGNYKPIRSNQNLNINQIETQRNEEAIKITSEEKKFFTKMYPDNKEQIDTYHFYNKEGDKKGVSLGSLFDKRG
jgi:hypothetical protein